MSPKCPFQSFNQVEIVNEILRAQIADQCRFHMAPSTILVYARIKAEYDEKRPSYEIIRKKKGFESLKIFDASKKSNEKGRIFRFNKIFPKVSSQEEVFDVIAKPLIKKVLLGINATIFAYGATGSGKTYTLTGSTGYMERGIIPRTIEYIFERANQNNYMFYISYLEIYNENAYDLLRRKYQALQIEELPRVVILEDADGDVHYKNLSLKQVRSEEEAMCLLYAGESNRMIAETPLNICSSRSHCVFTIHVISTCRSSGQITRSKLNLVDLAGSERLHRMNLEGMTLNEARRINLSLHYLERVIQALSQKGKIHVPYRNSMMTFILRDSLGGNCLTAMLATLSLIQANLEESMSTCRFSQRVCLVKYEANVNFLACPETQLTHLKNELKRVKRELNEIGDSSLKLSREEEIECKQAIEEYLRGNDSVIKFNEARKVKFYIETLRCQVLEQLHNKTMLANKYHVKHIEQSYQKLVEQKEKEIEMLIDMYEGHPANTSCTNHLSVEPMCACHCNENDIRTNEDYQAYATQAPLINEYNNCIKKLRHKHTTAVKIAQLMGTKQKQIELMKQTIRLGTQNGSDLKIKLNQDQSIYRELMTNMQCMKQSIAELKREMGRIKVKIIDDFKRS